MTSRFVIVVLPLIVVPILFFARHRYVENANRAVIANVQQTLERAIESDGDANRVTLARSAHEQLAAEFDQPEEGTDAEILTRAAAVIMSPRDAVAVPKISDSATTESILLLGRVLFHSGYARASKDVVDSVLLRTDNREDSLRLATLVNYELGFEDEVLRYSNELSELVPDDPRPWLVQAEIHHVRSHWPQLLESLEAAAKRQPEDRTIFFRLADAYVRVGDALKARETFDRLGLDPHEQADDICRLAARIHFLEGQNDAARELLDFYQQTRPNDPAVLLLLGRIEAAEQNFERAIDILEDVVELDPLDHEAYYTLGQAYARSGDKEAAKTSLDRQRFLIDKKKRLYDLERSIGREPNNAEAISELISECEALGMSDAANYWRRMRDRIEGSQPGDAVD